MRARDERVALRTLVTRLREWADSEDQQRRNADRVWIIRHCADRIAAIVGEPLCPRCQRPFEAIGKQRFCSPRCATNAKAEQYRRRRRAASTEEAFMERLRATGERQIAPPKKRGRRRAA